MRRFSGCGAVLLAMCSLLALGAAAPVHAQEGRPDPYGSTTTTSAPSRTATVRLTVHSGPRGTSVGVYACGYAPGVVGGSVTFDSEVVATGLIANASGCLTGGVQSDPPLTIQVPADARPGQRNVCAVVSGYNTPCAKFRVTGGVGAGDSTASNDTEVLGVSVSRALPGEGLEAFTAPVAVLLVVALMAGRRRRAGRRRYGRSTRRLGLGARADR